MKTDRAIKRLTVKSYCVVHKDPIIMPDGKRVLCAPIGRHTLSLRRAKIDYKRLKPIHHDAEIMIYRRFFNPNRPGDFAERRSYVEALRRNK